MHCSSGEIHTATSSSRLRGASALLLLGILICTVGTAHATEVPRVELRILDTGAGALPGIPFHGTLELSSPLSLTLDDFEVHAPDGVVTWKEDPEELAKARGLTLHPGESRRFEFTLITTTGVDPLMVEYEVEGQRVTRSLDLSHATYLAGKHGHATIELPGVPSGPVVAPSTTGGGQLQPIAAETGFARRKPSEKRPDLDLDRKPGEAAKAYNLRVHGRFVYYRPSTSGAIGAQGAAVRIYDEDTFSDQLLMTTVTDENGNFDITFNYSDSEAPDLYVQFEAANNRVQVEESGILENNYRWNTSTWGDYSGTVLNIGTHTPSNEGHRPALHILTQLSRAWIYVNSQGWDTPSVDAQWPDGTSGAWYDGEIHMSPGAQWDEPTIIHEWGHHWIEHFARDRPPIYCNGYCDAGSCGHCLWCPETDAVAFSEGWPDWFSEHITRYFGTRYSPPPLGNYSFESLNECWDGSVFFLADPWTTEGSFSAFLLDLEDSAQDDHPEYALGVDALDFDFSTVLGFTDSFEPETSHQFLGSMLLFYVSIPEEIWDTAVNCGYDLDTTPPGAPITLGSPSHTVGFSSPDNTVDLSWTKPTDDASGAGGYSLLVTTNGPAMPDATAEIGRVTSYTHLGLAPGTHYFNLRAQDRSGKWSASYATYGPVIIRDPLPVNLVYRASFSWPRSLIPRPAPDVVYGGPGGSYIADPTTLDPSGTYLNMFAFNVGEQSTAVGPSAIYYVDEEYVYEANWAPLAADQDMVAVNMGPFSSAPGRHVLHSWLDGYEWIAETNESDNFEGHQWVWQPRTITENTPVVMDRPPGSVDGWAFVNDGQTLFSNVDGFRYSPTGYWQAVVLHPLNSDADLDLFLYDLSTGPGNGFETALVSSVRIEGKLDATLINGNVAAWDNRDVGVNNYNAADGSYILTYLNSSMIVQDTPTIVSMGVNEMLFVREFNAIVSGLYTVHVETSDPGVPVAVRWYPSDFQMGGLDQATAQAITDANGMVDLELNLSLTGWNGIAVFREPGTGSAPLDVLIEVGPTKPELHYVTDPGWYAPVVPRAAADATPSNTPAPAMLTGNAASTYLNTSLINDGGMISSFDAGIYLDGDQNLVQSHYYIDQPPQTTAYTNNNSSAVIFPGGRHTLVAWVDPSDLVVEQTELNNLYGEQWIWSPFPLSEGPAVTRSEPSNRLGGIDGLTTAEPFYFNSDGLRTPLFAPGQPGPRDASWAAVAIMPRATSDLDLRLHAMSTGAQDGFASPMVVSAWGEGHSDFVLVNLRLTGPTQFDAGVVNLGVPGGNYGVQATSSRHRADLPQGVIGPFSMAAGSIVDLHTFTLLPAEYDILLESLSGNIDWGMTVHRADLAYAGKSDELPNGTAWLAGPGQAEGLTVTIPQSGEYLVSVWRVRSNDLDLTGSYQLTFTPKTTGIEDQPVQPLRSGLSSVAPNPFNPSTQISFSLAHPGRVELRIYNVHGKLVRTLLEEPRTAGRHAMRWNGRDGTGSTVSSGIYFVRMLAEGVDDRKKVTLLK